MVKMRGGRAVEALEESASSPENAGGWRSNVGGGTSDRAEEARQALSTRGLHGCCTMTCAYTSVFTASRALDNVVGLGPG